MWSRPTDPRPSPRPSKPPSVRSCESGGRERPAASRAVALMKAGRVKQLRLVAQTRIRDRGTDKKRVRSHRPALRDVELAHPDRIRRMADAEIGRRRERKGKLARIDRLLLGVRDR